jgi:hypothetical protein
MQEYTLYITTMLDHFFSGLSSKVAAVFVLFFLISAAFGISNFKTIIDRAALPLRMEILGSSQLEPQDVAIVRKSTLNAFHPSRTPLVRLDGRLIWEERNTFYKSMYIGLPDNADQDILINIYKDGMPTLSAKVVDITGKWVKVSRPPGYEVLAKFNYYQVPFPSNNYNRIINWPSASNFVFTFMKKITMTASFLAAVFYSGQYLLRRYLSGLQLFSICLLCAVCAVRFIESPIVRDETVKIYSRIFGCRDSALLPYACLGTNQTVAAALAPRLRLIEEPEFGLIGALGENGANGLDLMVYSWPKYYSNTDFPNVAAGLTKDFNARTNCKVFFTNGEFSLGRCTWNP